MAPMTIPYGAWPSPISAADRARGSLLLSFPDAVAGSGEVWWTEGRPDEAGRQVVVRAGLDGRPADLLPQPWNARTRVHEYGGRSWLPVPAPRRQHGRATEAHADQAPGPQAGQAPGPQAGQTPWLQAAEARRPQ